MKGTAYTLHAQGVRQQAARGVRVRRLPLLGRFVLSMFLAFAIICQPYTLAYEGWQIKAQKQEAQAIPAAVPGAFAFLESVAAAGSMSVGDFMLTGGIIIAASSGFNIMANTAQYGASGTVNGLHKLVSTAEWPSWDELDSATQQSWGSEANYTAGQFNQYLDVFGLGEARDSYYASGGTGGDDFDSASKSIIERIGAIGQKWANGQAVTVSEAFNTLENGDLTTRLQSLGRPDFVNAETIGLERLYVYSLDNAIVGYMSGSKQRYQSRAMTLTCKVAYIVYSNQQRVEIVNDLPFRYASYDGTSKVYPNISGPTSQASTFTYNAKSGYGAYIYPGVAFNDVFYAPNILSNAYSSDLNNHVKYLMLYGESYHDTNMQDFEEGETPADNIEADELTPSTTWPSLFTDLPTPTPDPVFPESDFNPDVGDDGGDYIPETSTPEWQEKTQEQIFKPVLSLPFNRMFPFCVIFDISLLMDKLYELGGYQAVSADQSTSLRSLYADRDGLQVQADEESKGGSRAIDWNKPGWTVGHTEIVLPLRSFAVDGMDELEIDVWPLAVLLQWLKPFFQLAFIAGLLFVTIVTFRMFIFTD